MNIIVAIITASGSRRLRQTGFRVLDVVGGFDAPIRGSKYGFRSITGKIMYKTGKSDASGVMGSRHCENDKASI